MNNSPISLRELGELSWHAVPTLVDQAIVLRCWEFSETSQTVSLLTQAHGVLRGLAKGARRTKSTFSGGFEPLTRGEIVAITKPTTELATLTEWDLQEIYWGPRRATRAHYAGLYLADVTHHALLPGDPHPVVFETLSHALHTLDGTLTVDLIVLQYLWNLLTDTGYRPRLDLDDLPLKDPRSRTLGFDPHTGRVVPDPHSDHNVSRPALSRSGQPGRIWRVRSQTVSLLQDLSHAVRLDDRPPDQLRRASRLLAAYLSTILGKEIASAPALFGSG